MSSSPTAAPVATSAATSAAAPKAADEWRFPNRATPPGSSAYYSIRFAPAELRDALAALFGWRFEVKRIIDEVSDPGVARLKLDWWREEILRSIDGEPRHPLSHLLAPAITAFTLPAEPFLDQAQQVENELYSRHSADQQARQQALAQDRGALFELICRCHGLTEPALAEPATLANARDTGAWCEQVRRLRDSGLLLRRGREVMPTGLLQAAGLGAEQLASPQHRQQLPALLTPLAATLSASRPDTTGLPRALRIQDRIHAALLDELVRSGFDVVNQHIGLTPLRKLWIAWRTKAIAVDAHSDQLPFQGS